MLFKVVSRNTETIQINHFAAQDPEGKDKDAQVIMSFEMIIPADAGDFAAAAMVKGCKQFFLDTFMKPEAYDKDQKDLFEHAEQVLLGLDKALVPDNVSPIVRP
jgi:hypothetical protein